MNGAPKQVEKVACGSLPRPFSVPATLAVIAGEEVIHRLARRELGDRRQHAEGIGGQHDDVLGVAGTARSGWRWR